MISTDNKAGFYDNLARYFNATRTTGLVGWMQMAQRQIRMANFSRQTDELLNTRITPQCNKPSMQM